MLLHILQMVPGSILDPGVTIMSTNTITDAYLSTSLSLFFYRFWNIGHSKKNPSKSKAPFNIV